MRRTRIAAFAAALVTTVPALAAAVALAASPTTFNYTGAEQTYTVPPSIHFPARERASAAAGGNAWSRAAAAAW